MTDKARLEQLINDQGYKIVEFSSTSDGNNHWCIINLEKSRFRRGDPNAVIRFTTDDPECITYAGRVYAEQK